MERQHCGGRLSAEEQDVHDRRLGRHDFARHGCRVPQRNRYYRERITPCAAYIVFFPLRPSFWHCLCSRWCLRHNPRPSRAVVLDRVLLKRNSSGRNQIAQTMVRIRIVRDRQYRALRIAQDRPRELRPSAEMVATVSARVAVVRALITAVLPSGSELASVRTL